VDRGVEDFDEYVHARWTWLVLGLEREGVPADRARLAVANALLDHRRGWRRLVREAQPDVEVWQDARERAGLPRLRDPVPALGREPAGSDDPDGGPDAWLRRSAAARRTRSTRWAVGLAVTVVAIASAVAWSALRPDAPAVREARNPIPVPWYAAGELHLAEVVVELPGIEVFVADGTGVVARLETGELVRVADDGTVSETDDVPDAFHQVPDLPDLVPVGATAVVLQGVPLPDGGWAYVLHAGRAPRDDLRASESGRRTLVLCDEGQRCVEADLGLSPDSGVRVR
jgi:hypothetical protein